MRVLAAVALALSSLACAAGAATAPAPPHVVIFVDRTESITARERAIWHRESQVIVDALKAGSSVDIFELHDRTVEAGALLSASSFRPPADATMHEIMRGRAALKTLRESVAVALEAAFATSMKSSGTDVLGFIDRVRVLPGRVTRVVLFTDAVHETRELNLAKVRIRANGIQEMASRLISDRAWPAGRLKGVAVWFVLNSSEAGEAAASNQRGSLRAFYEHTISACGGQVTTFDTELGLRAFGM